MSTRTREFHIIMGGDGSGKSTVTEKVAELISATYFDTGLRLREYNQAHCNPALSNVFQNRELADEDLVRHLVTEAIMGATGDICFCGIPRTLEQAEWLIMMADQHDFRIAGWYCLNVELETCMSRIEKRTGREKVSPDKQRQSIIAYNTMMTDVYDLVSAKYFAAIIDAEPPAEDVIGSLASLPTIQQRIMSMA